MFQGFVNAFESYFGLQMIWIFDIRWVLGDSSVRNVVLLEAQHVINK